MSNFIKFLDPVYIYRFKKPIWPFFFSLLFLYLINILKTFFKISFYEGDYFFKMFSFLQNYQIYDLIPMSLFMNFSLISVFIFPLLFVFFLFIYAVFIQFFLYLFVSKPSRFTHVLNPMFLYSSIFYIFSVIPFVGILISKILFIIFFIRSLCFTNSIGKFKGFVILCMPGFLFLFLLAILLIKFLIPFI